MISEVLSETEKWVASIAESYDDSVIPPGRISVLCATLVTLARACQGAKISDLPQISRQIRETSEAIAKEVHDADPMAELDVA